jgi:L-ascorbate metabolism protein UlaG (beta-lactamase superfamily)
MSFTVHRRFLIIAALAVMAVPGALLVARAAAPGPAAKLTWYGQACFLLESAGGTRVVMDPIPGAIGYTPPADLKADVVTVSHEHGDHNNVALVQGKPKVLRGLTEDKKGWVRVNEKAGDVAIRSVGVYHDEEKGAKRGLNAVFVFEVAGVRIAHLGDLGHLLDDKQVSAIGNVDVVLIPVGGFFTIDARQATRVVDQLRPRLIVVPMHYKTDVLTIKELATVDAFLAGKPNVRREKGNTLSITGVKARPSTEVVVLNYK